MAAPGIPARTLPSRDQVRAAVIDAVASEPAVLAVYLFGSTTRDQEGPLSDLDVAVLLDAQVDGAELAGRLTDVLSRQLKSDHVDLVSLREAPVPVRYRVVRDGLLLMSRDEAARQRFTAETVLLYLDFAPLRDRAFARVRDGILGEE
jgi:predicted nucleotidyltransferase